MVEISIQTDRPQKRSFQNRKELLQNIDRGAEASVRANVDGPQVSMQRVDCGFAPCPEWKLRKVRKWANSVGYCQGN